MKTTSFKKVNFKLISQLLLVAVFATFAVSCEQESMVSPDMQAMSAQETTDDANARFAPGNQAIAEIAIDSEDFNELVAALSYVDSELDAGLVDLFLNGTDQYTVFAPTDVAFMDLYDDQGVDDITELPAGLVLDVLLYHVTEGRRASNSVVPKQKPRKIETLLGESFSVNSDLSIDAIGNTANITAADISASNGIIHVIDVVILPIE